MQSVILSISGIYTSVSDYQGLPAGALESGDNIEIRYKNTCEARRGFEELADSSVEDITYKRLVNFWIEGEDQIIALTNEGDLVYYTGDTPWPAVPGDFSSDIVDPDSIHAKSRFALAGQNLYITSQDGIRSLASGPDQTMLRAGVPKGLNLSGVTNGDTSGFLNNNVVLTTTGNTTSASAILSHLAATTGIAVGQYVSGSGITVGTKVSSITPEATLIVQNGYTTAGSTSITNLTALTGIVAGVLVSGNGIPEGARVVSTSGAGPYTAVLDVAAFQTQGSPTGVDLTFTSAIVVTLDQNAGSTLSATALKFYTGSQVAYRMVFGRVETDINGGTITRIGAPSSQALVTNILATPTNTTVVGTLPKNSDNLITFVQLFRSAQTSSTDITPLDQYNLVYERELESADFTARTISITDETDDSLVGIPLYTGSDQEGILQANNPPPMAWDVCKFRDFTLFGNITRPSTLSITILAAGPSDGVQVADTITIAGDFQGTPYSRTYTAASTEDATTQTFKVFTAGTPSQDITDTTNSLIRVINYDESLPVHAILLSTSTDLAGQILLEADHPSYDTFTVIASAHGDAYDPDLTAEVESEVNTLNNGVGVSKLGELEAVPSLNLYYVGDSSSDVVRLIPLRDYVICIKRDGVYKIQGTDPRNLTVNPFDLTTHIIGSDTAVSLNSSVWMLSNQGVVSISDGGVDAGKSIPIDDQLSRLIGTQRDNLEDVGFAIGYESDRKYILFLPETSDDENTTNQFNFNYVTNAWTTWSRDIFTAFIHSNEDKLYISRADLDSQGVSQERKSGTFRDYVDEGLERSITAINETLVTLSTLLNSDGDVDIHAGDIMYDDDTHFSPILSVDVENSQVTIQNTINFSVGSITILKSYQTSITWKQVFGDNPAFMRQFSEGMFLFKNSQFKLGVARFSTDFSRGISDVDIEGSSNGLYGLFPWGEVPWGGALLPDKIRFYIPQDKQVASYLIPSLRIRQGYSNWKNQGLAIYYSNISPESGK